MPAQPAPERGSERRLDGAHPGAEAPGEGHLTIPIVIDCDPGHDDAIAILLALASPEVELRGVVTVAGNQTVDKTTRNALKVLELAGRAHIPVARGADAPLRRPLRTAAHVHGESGLDGPDLPEPSTAIYEGDPGEWLEPGVVLVATGPLTNVARFVQRGVAIERIVWMGGAIAEGNITPAAEFNAFVDPEAAAAVFGSGIELTMVGLDVTHKALFTRAHADRLRGTPVLFLDLAKQPEVGRVFVRVGGLVDGHAIGLGGGDFPAEEAVELSDGFVAVAGQIGGGHRQPLS